MPAADQDRDAIGQREHDVHVVLDQQNRVLPLDARQQLRHRARFLEPQARPSAHRGAASPDWSRAPSRARAGDAGRATCGPRSPRRPRRGRHRRAACAPAGAARESARRRARTGSCAAPVACTASAMLLSAEKLSKTLLIWNDRARPSRARWAVASSVMSCPRKLIRPASGSSSPVNCPTNVVLPAPFGPISAWVSPVRMPSVTSSVATSAPKALRRWRISRRKSLIGSLPDLPWAPRRSPRGNRPSGERAFPPRRSHERASPKYRPSRAARVRPAAARRTASNAR